MGRADGQDHGCCACMALTHPAQVPAVHLSLRSPAPSSPRTRYSLLDLHRTVVFCPPKHHRATHPYKNNHKTRHCGRRGVAGTTGCRVGQRHPHVDRASAAITTSLDTTAAQAHTGQTSAAFTAAAINTSTTSINNHSILCGHSCRPPVPATRASATPARHSALTPSGPPSGHHQDHIPSIKTPQTTESAR